MRSGDTALGPCGEATLGTRDTLGTRAGGCGVSGTTTLGSWVPGACVGVTLVVTLGSCTLVSTEVISGAGTGKGSTRGGGGIARCSSVAIFCSAFVVSSQKVRKGAIGDFGSFRMAKISLIDCRR